MAIEKDIVRLSSEQKDCQDSGSTKKYWNESISGKKCVTNCESGFYKTITVAGGSGDVDVKVCIEKSGCDSRTFETDNTLKKCVADCGTNAYQEDTDIAPDEDGAYFKCRSTQTCESSDYTVSDKGKTYCYSAGCPSDYLFVDSANNYKCLKTCDSKYYDDTIGKKVCQATCSGNFYLEDKSVVSGETYFKCAAACAAPTTDFIVKDGDKNYCYAGACPTDKPVYDDKKVCTEKCADTKNKYWTGTECKDKCPTGKPVYDTTNYICAEKCSTESHFWDPMAEKCVSGCPSDPKDRKADKDSIVCKTCREAATDNSKTYYYDASKGSDNCVVSCGSDKYLENDYCKASCTSGFYRVDSDNNKVCVDVCGANEFATIKSGSAPSECVAECGSSAAFYKIAETADGKEYRQCVSSSDCKYYISEQLEITGKTEK